MEASALGFKVLTSDQLDHLNFRQTSHWAPSFERRLTILVALVWLLLASVNGEVEKGVYLSFLTVVCGEVLVLCFGADYAFGLRPSDLEVSESSLDDMLHPLVIKLYVVIACGLVFFSVTNLGIVAAWLVGTAFVSLAATFAARVVYDNNEVAPNQST